MNKKRVKVDGRSLLVPVDATPDEIDELAKASSPTSEIPVSAPSAPPELDFLGALGHELKGFKNALLPDAELSDVMEAPGRLLGAGVPLSQDNQLLGESLLEMGKTIATGPVRQFGKAKQSLSDAASTLFDTSRPFMEREQDARMNMMEMSGNLLGMLPLVGEGAAHVGRKIGTGQPEQVLEGIGEGLGLMVGVKGATSRKAPTAIDPGAIATQAVRPGVFKGKQFQEAFNNALPALKEAAQVTGIPFDKISRLGDLIPEAKRMFWEKYNQLLDPNKGATVNPIDVGTAMESQITQRFARNNPKAAKAIQRQADYYRKNKLTLADLEAELQGVNNELEAYYASNPKARRHDRANPEIGYKVAEAEALRKTLYDQLNKLTGKNAAELKRIYGSLNQIELPVMRQRDRLAQKSDFDLGDRFNLASGFGDIAYSVVTGHPGAALEGAAKIGMNRFLNHANQPDTIMGRAYKASQKPPSYLPFNPLIAPSFTGTQATRRYDENGNLLPF